MAITPDTKDWTSVLERPCGECGFDAGVLEVGAIPDRLRENAAAWRFILGGRPDEELRRRPSDDRWSDLEYACHVRDVFRMASLRLGRMLDDDDPMFQNWDQDATAVEDRYGEQDPSMVAGELSEAANALADSYAAVPENAWSRPGRRSDGANFTIGSFGRYIVHDPTHHLVDVGYTGG